MATYKIKFDKDEWVFEQEVDVLLKKVKQNLSEDEKARIIVEIMSPEHGLTRWETNWE
jgi:hypothetical protein